MSRLRVLCVPLLTALVFGAVAVYCHFTAPSADDPAYVVGIWTAKFLVYSVTCIGTLGYRLRLIDRDNYRLSRAVSLLANPVLAAAACFAALAAVHPTALVVDAILAVGLFALSVTVRGAGD